MKLSRQIISAIFLSSLALLLNSAASVSECPYYVVTRTFQPVASSEQAIEPHCSDFQKDTVSVAEISSSNEPADNLEDQDNPVEEDFDELIIRVVRKKSCPFVPKKEKGQEYHLVCKGESLSRIANYYGVSLKYLMSYNNLTSSKILLGQKLFIPSKNSALIRMNEKYVWPLCVSGRISSKFGSRIHPITRLRSFHNGIDIAAPTNTKIRASKSGTVYFSGYRRLSGKTVIIKHSGNVHTIYAHCNKLLVKKGQKVSSGSVIALVGKTGRATGSHVHFSIKKGNKYLNPLKYLCK